MKNELNLEVIKTTPLKKRRTAVTRMPDWLVRLKGWVWAKKGVGACEAEIARLMSRCAAVENSMCAELEGAILQLRIDSSVCQLKANHTGKKPGPPSDNASPIELRAVHAAATNYDAKQNAAEAAKENIAKIHEDLLSKEGAFYQEIEHICAFTRSKIFAFVSGVRSCKRTKLADFYRDDTVVFNDTAFTYYKRVHEANDRAREYFLDKLNHLKEGE